METIEKEQIKKEAKAPTGIPFKALTLLTFAVISRPGKYLLEVFSNVTDANLIPAEEGVNAHHIVTLRAIMKDKLAQAKEVFDGKTEVPIEDTNSLFATANVWKGPLPMKGEKVECVIDYVDNQEKTERVLRVTGMRVAAAQEADKFSFDAEPASAQAGAGQGNDLVTKK